MCDSCWTRCGLAASRLRCLVTTRALLALGFALGASDGGLSCAGRGAVAILALRAARITITTLATVASFTALAFATAATAAITTAGRRGDPAR